jgi:ribosomal protein L37AE/L43A
MAKKSKIYYRYTCRECGKKFKRPRPHVTAISHEAFKSFMRQVRDRQVCPSCKRKLALLKRGK